MLQISLKTHYLRLRIPGCPLIAHAIMFPGKQGALKNQLQPNEVAAGMTVPAVFLFFYFLPKIEVFKVE